MRWLAQGIPTKDELAEMIAVRPRFSLVLTFRDGLVRMLTSLVRVYASRLRKSFFQRNLVHRALWRAGRSRSLEVADVEVNCSSRCVEDSRFIGPGRLSMFACL